MNKIVTRFRALAATPGMLLTAVATIGLGVGLNAVLFAILFPSTEGSGGEFLRAVKIDGAGQPAPVSGGDVYRLSLNSEWFRDVFTQARWDTQADSKAARGLIVSENYFTAFGVSPLLTNPIPGKMPEIVMSRRAALSFFSWPVAPVGQWWISKGARFVSQGPRLDRLRAPNQRHPISGYWNSRPRTAPRQGFCRE